MSSLSIPSNLDSAALSVPKLRDDGSNWSDYEPRIKRAMGAKGLWIHIEGKATPPKPYQLVNNVPTLSDSKTKATEEQIETREAQIIDYEKCKCLAQHDILSMTSTRIGAVIKNLNTTHEMWEKVKTDATTKSTLYLINAEDQLANIQVSDLDNPWTHFTELKQHLELMAKCHDNLIQTGSSISPTRFSTMIMSLLPPSYCWGVHFKNWS